MTYPSDWVTRFSATSYTAFRGDILTGDSRDDDFYGFHLSGHEVMGGYEGPFVANDPIDPTGSQIATPTQQLDTWGIQVAAMLDTKGSNGGPLCYTYGPSGTDNLAMSPVTCPNTPPVVMITDAISNSTLLIYPIAGMIAMGLCFAGYTARKELMNAPDLRIGDRLYNPDHWVGRVNREPSAHHHRTNVFYKHITD
ncbi:hypothetical protein HDU98_003079 [Podochytrium sp. JEL0797]|nr:hypothetical protein HDU98_003079 [Podochytrium sp. JEL0797]